MGGLGCPHTAELGPSFCPGPGTRRGFDMREVSGPSLLKKILLI